MAHLLPSFVHLNLADIGAGCDDADDDDDGGGGGAAIHGWDLAAQSLREKLSEYSGPPPEDDPIYFVAARAGDFRKLSNLFGPTEWVYHARSKFLPLSKAYLWLMEQAQLAKNRTPATDAHFMELINRVSKKTKKQLDAAAEKGVDPCAFWQTPDGEPACGLAAKMLTNFASVAHVAENGTSNWDLKGPGEADKRKRFLTFLELIGEKEDVKRIEQAKKKDAKKALIDKWTRDNMIPENTETKVAALRFGIEEKYPYDAANPYTALLLSTGMRMLHEERSARKDSSKVPPSTWPYIPWVWSPNRDAQSRSGDIVGMMLRLRRYQVRLALEQEERQAKLQALDKKADALLEEAEALVKKMEREEREKRGE